MAKQYVNFGSVVKGKDGKPDYIKLSSPITVHLRNGERVELAQGAIVNLQSKKNRLETVDYLEENNKISDEAASSMRERASKIPEWVRFEIEAVVDKK